MRTCYIDMKNHVVKEYSMTWENVDDTFLSEKSCFQNSMIPNMKKKGYFCLFTHVCVGRQIRLLHWIAYATTRYPFSSSLCLSWQLTSYSSQFRVSIPMPLGILTKISGMSGWVPCPNANFSPSGQSGNTFSMGQDSYRMSTNENVCMELIGRIFQIHGCT